MSITGQVGHVAFAKQTAFGTPNTTAGNYKPVKITGDSLVAANNMLVAEGEIGTGRDVTQAVPGGFSAAGAINGNLTGRSFAVTTYAALGTITANTATGTDGSFDAFTPADTLPVFTVEKQIGTTGTASATLRYQDTMVNTLNISANAGALSTYSAGLIACGESFISGGPLVTEPISWPATSSDLLVFHGGRLGNKDSTDADTVTFSYPTDADVTFQTMEVVINNNVQADEYTIRPSRFLRSLTEGIRSVEINCTIVFESNAVYRKYTYGGATATAPGYALYMGAIDFTLANWQIADADSVTKLAPTGAPANPQAVQFIIPKLAFSGLPVALTSGRIAVSTTARALKPTTGGIVKAIVRPSGAGF